MVGTLIGRRLGPILGSAVLLLGACARHAPPAGASHGVQLSVFCSVSPDPSRHGLVYQYSVCNRAESPGTADLIAQERVGDCDSVDAPPGWIVMQGGYQGRPRSLVWAAIGLDDSIPSNLGFMRRPPGTAVLPGQAASGFRLRARGRPVFTSLYAPPFESDVVDGGEEAGTHAHGTIWEAAAAGEMLAPGTAYPRRGSWHSFFPPKPRPIPTPAWIQLFYLLPTPSQVRLEILDAWGGHVLTLRDARELAGGRSVAWFGNDERGHTCPVGEYEARLQVDGHLIGSHRVELVR